MRGEVPAAGGDDGPPGPRPGDQAGAPGPRLRGGTRGGNGYKRSSREKCFIYCLISPCGPPEAIVINIFIYYVLIMFHMTKYPKLSS